MIILNRYMHWVIYYIFIKYILQNYREIYSYSEKLEDFDYFEVRVFWRLYILKSLTNPKAHYCISEIIEWNHYFILYTHLAYSTALNWMLMWCITSQHWHFWMLLYFLNKICIRTSFKWDVFLIKMQSSAWVNIFAYTI